MTKTLSKLLAFVLSVSMLFTVSVMVNAEEFSTVSVSCTLYDVSGNWEDDYAEKITIIINGDVVALAEDAVVTVGAGTSNSNLFSFNAGEISSLITPGGGVTVFVPFNNYVNHAETYNFYFAEGTFVSADGELSEELTLSVTGNEIVEKIDVEHISVRPIEKLIDWMYTWGAEGFWLDVINFVVSILEWFLYI